MLFPGHAKIGWLGEAFLQILRGDLRVRADQAETVMGRSLPATESQAIALPCRFRRRAGGFRTLTANAEFYRTSPGGYIPGVTIRHICMQSVIMFLSRFSENASAPVILCANRCNTGNK
jgi:hypothetical protein